MTVKQTNKRGAAAKGNKPAAVKAEQDKELDKVVPGADEQGPASLEPAPESAPEPGKELEAQAGGEPDQGAKGADDKELATDAAATDGAIQEGAKGDTQGDSQAESGGVRLEVATRLPRRIRAGVVVTRAPAVVEVSEAVASELEADRHIKVKRL